MLILDAVKDISSSIQKLVFVSINDSAALNCTVRAYPAILKNAVTVNHDGISFKEFSFTAIDNLVDGFLIELTFDSVEQNDYGSYYVSLNNGLTDDSIIELQLLKKVMVCQMKKFLQVIFFLVFFTYSYIQMEVTFAKCIIDYITIFLYVYRCIIIRRHEILLKKILIVDLL